MPGLSKTNKKFVWRVENAEGDGPYVGYDGSEWWKTRSHVDVVHPTFIEDNFGPRQEEKFFLNRSLYKYGFVSKKQALEWFSVEELNNLATRGYKLQRVTASYVISNRRAKQCAFIPG